MDVLPLRTTETLTAKTNFAGFDAVRAIAAVGVVLLHSCVPYLKHPMPGLTWAVRDTAHSWVDFSFWMIELFIMPLFLVMAGFLAFQTLNRRGATVLVKSRAKRLLLPLLFGVIVILPLDLYSWVLGWVAEGVAAPVKLKSLKFDGVVDRDLWGLSHLWFLQYLFLYVAALATLVHLRDRLFGRHHIGLSTSKIAVTLWLVAAGTLWLRPQVVWGFQHHYLPVPSKWIYSGLFFAGGILLAVRDPQLRWLREHAIRFVAPALLLALAAVTLGQWHLGAAAVIENPRPMAAVTLALLTSAAAATLTLGILGIAVARIKRISSAISYLSAASFWIYLVHHPILAVVHLDLKWLLPGANPITKVLVALTTAVGISLLTYEGFVRRTALGRWLGFDWTPPIRGADQSDVISLDTARAPVNDDTETRRAA